MIVAAIPPPFANPYSVPCSHIHTPVVPSHTPDIPRSIANTNAIEYHVSPPMRTCPPKMKVERGFSKDIYFLCRFGFETLF